MSEFDALMEYIKEHKPEIESVYILNRKYRLIEVRKRERGWIDKELTGFVLEYILISEGK